jgi:hypothetical protein
MQAGTLYHSSTPVLWRCANCGHEQQLTDPWQRCPDAVTDRRRPAPAADAGLRLIPFYHAFTVHISIDIPIYWQADVPFLSPFP